MPNLPIKNSLESIGSGPMLRIRVDADGEVREGVDSGGVSAQGVNRMESGQGWDQAV